jgi:hypothetical protein
MAGGLLEYAALVTGYRNLLVLVAVAYGLAFVTGRHHLAVPPADKADTEPGEREAVLA